MSQVHIEWGDLERSEAIEQYIQERSVKLFTMAPEATKLVVHFQITNAQHSSGVSAQKLNMELRLPHHQDLHTEQEGSDLYQCIRDGKKALLAQLTKRKGHVDRTRANEMLTDNEEGELLDDLG